MMIFHFTIFVWNLVEKLEIICDRSEKMKTRMSGVFVRQLFAPNVYGIC